MVIGTSDEYQAAVWRCRRCGAYWEVPAFSYPTVISREQAQRELPDLDALENAAESALGIQFPKPPR